MFSEDEDQSQEISGFQSAERVDKIRHLSPKKRESNEIPPLRKELFINQPSWLPKSHPIVVLDHWEHGQLIWWNRFLANRKKTRGLSVGYHVGKVKTRSRAIKRLVG